MDSGFAEDENDAMEKLREFAIQLSSSKVSEVSNFDYLTKNYKGHSFFLFGENSEYYDKNDDNIIKKFFPNSKISLIRNASHWLHVENPKDFFNEIKSWI